MRRTPSWRALAPLLIAAGAAVAPGCSAETEPEAAPPGAPAPANNHESTADKLKDKANQVGAAVAKGTGQAIQSAGRAAEAEAVKLEGAGADAVKRNVGETAGKAVEATGNAIGRAGEAAENAGKKLQDSAKETPK